MWWLVYCNIYVTDLVKQIIPEYSTSMAVRKQAVVGSLLVYPLEKDCKYKLATWYRVGSESKKIVKMHTIKSELNLSYRCTVFDVGSTIELRIQTNGVQELMTYGPAKYDAYLSKQLETKMNNCSFAVNVHVKPNETLPLRLKVIINQEGICKFYFCKEDKQIYFQLSLRPDWGGYEQIFDIQDVKLTDICLRQIQSSELFKKKLQSIGIFIENRNYLLMTFSNVVQRNLFLAYILKKARDYTEKARNSQLKSITNSECKKSLVENEIDDLFKSNFLQHTPRLSEKTFNDLKQVVFTPQNNLDSQQIIRERGFTVGNFGQFLNPEENKQAIEKLSDIAEEQSELPDKTILNLKKQSPRKSLTTENEKLFEEIKKIQKDRQLKWKQIISENKGLKEQNKKLKIQNQFLRKKLRRIRSNAQVKYQIPDYIRKSIKAHQENGPKSCRSKKNQFSNIEREKTLQFSEAQSPAIIKERFSGKIQTGNFSGKQTKQEFRKKMGNTISESTKTVKKFIHVGVTRSHQ